MPSHLRQHKSPYFYVQKGSGFVLLDNHEETQTRYKTEAEAKKAVLALNNAWRAKHGTSVKKSNPRPPMRRNFFGIFKSKPPLYRVTAHNRDGSTEVQTSTSYADLDIALEDVGIKERAIPNLMAAASREDFVDSGGDFKRQKDAYGWYRVTIELVGPRPEAKSNPRKYDESKDGAGYHTLSNLKKGEFFKRKPTARKVYTKGDYDRGSKKYGCGDYEAAGDEIFLKGDTMVYVGFDY